MALLLGQSLLPMVLVICWRVLLGAYSSRLLFDWSLPEEFDVADAVLRIGENPNASTEVAFEYSCSGFFYVHFPGQSWRSRRYRHLEDIGPAGGVDSCGGFCSVPGPLQCVTRAEF